MTHREKVLTTGLLGVLFLFGGGFLFHLFVYEPVSEVRTKLDSERESGRCEAAHKRAHRGVRRTLFEPGDGRLGRAEPFGKISLGEVRSFTSFLYKSMHEKYAIHDINIS